MAIVQHRIIQYTCTFLLLLMMGVAAVLARVQMTLPALDHARIKYWLWHDEWTDLANALWAETDFTRVYKLYDGDDYEIQARGGDFSQEDVELTSAQVSRYDALFSAAHIGRMARADNRLYIEGVSAVDRFGRTIVVDLVSPRDGYRDVAECDGQYNREHRGSCQVELGPNWLLAYHWYLPPAESWAKCAGIWEEYEAGMVAETSRNGVNEADRLWAVEELGEVDFERWAAAGREQLRLARSNGSQDEVDPALFGCRF